MNYLKKRAAIEEDYGKAMTKLAQSMYLSSDQKLSSSFDSAWQQLGDVTAKIGANKQSLATEIQTVEDDLQRSSKDCERSRKQIKESITRHSKAISDAESQLDRLRMKCDSSQEELERVRNEERYRSFQRDPVNNKRAGMLENIFKKKERSEEECWIRTNEARDSLHMQVDYVRELKNEYVSIHLPHFIKALKEGNDEFHVGLQISMLKYLNHFENYTVSDAETLSPVDQDSIKTLFSRVDHTADLREFISHYVTLYSEVPAVASTLHHSASSLPESVVNVPAQQTQVLKIFGRPLDVVCANEGNEGNPPKVLRVLVEEIEKYGMESQGLYKMNSSPNRLEQLKYAIDESPSKRVLSNPQVTNDMSTVANCVKLYLAELPERLTTTALGPEFLKAADIQDPHSRLLRVHELINELPDANYVTLRYVGKHLLKVAAVKANETDLIDASSVFGPILIYTPPNGISDPVDTANRQKIVMKTILDGYKSIFD